MTHLIVFTVIVAIVIAILVWQNALMSFKIGYYEEILQNNKDSFTTEGYKHINSIINKKTPF